jgi:hypothetical protein
LHLKMKKNLLIYTLKCMGHHMWRTMSSCHGRWRVTLQEWKGTISIRLKLSLALHEKRLGGNWQKKCKKLLWNLSCRNSVKVRLHASMKVMF